MTPEQQALVRESWARFAPAVRDAGAQFYDRLFELDPEARRLFASTDMALQEVKLMRMFDGIVHSLDRPADLVSEVAALGRRHTHYGVKDADYPSVGAALLWTLEQGLGEAFTAEVREAWSEAYLLVATVMRRAAAREHSAG
ncbi:MAG TPA: globin family protein [Gemmatimonadales bacterium]|jgi:hemoglobin-like flavoprotein|nr:globin family protein [Gemmatimonadales bacterium]